MKGSRLTGLLLVFAGMLLATPLVFGQADTGLIEGTVADTEGGLLPGVTVTAKNTATGLTRVDTSSVNGTYRLSALPPGVYALTAELSNFATVVTENVLVSVGKSTSIDVSMGAAKVAETVTVSAEAPLVESTQSDLSTVVNEKLIANLPLNGRKFQDLALMAPGVRSGNYYDPTKTEIGGTSMGGQQGRTTVFSIDGGDDRDSVVGGLLQQFPQDAIQEYEVTTQRFSAEYGRSPQGVVSVVTKSGTNELSGSVFGFFRDDKLNSNNYFNENVNIGGSDVALPDGDQADKPPFSQKQLGGSIGGPIATDKAFFFFTYERNKRDDYTTIVAGDIESGNFSKPFKNDMVVAKVNWNMSAENNMYVRYALENNRRERDFIGGNTLSTSGATNTNKIHSVLGSDTWILSADKLNEIHVQYSNFKNDITADNPNLPAIITPSFTLGANLNTPQQTIQKRFQVRDDLSMRKTGWMGDHDMKIGGEIIRTHFGGFFIPSLYGVFRYDTDDYQNASPTSFSGSASTRTIADGGGGTDDNWNYYAFYLNDDWKVSNKLTINAGLRYEVETGPFDVDFPDAITHQLLDTLGDGAAIPSSAERKTDKNNFGPRIGFAYDVAGDAKTVIRGGYGLYYDEIFQNITLYEGWYNPANPTQFVSLVPDFTPEQYGANRDYYRALLFDPTWKSQILRVTSNDLVMPYSQQFTIGMSKQLMEGVAFDVDFVHVLSLKEVARRAVNGGAADAGYENRGTAKLFPEYAELRFEGNYAHSKYDALQMAMRARYANASIQASYAYSVAKNIVDDFFTAPSNVNDWNSDWGFAPNDQAHVFALGGIFALPWDVQFSTVVAARSAKPFNTRAGTNLDNIAGSGADRPNKGTVLPDGSVFDGERNQNRAGSYISLDFRISKIFRLGDRAALEGLFEVFNITNHVNFNRDDYITSIRAGKGDAASFSPGWGDPTSAFAPRQAQFGVKFTF